MRRVLLLTTLIASPLLAQGTFEVASIKEQEGPTGRHFITSNSGSRFSCEACLLRELIMYAYHLANYEVAFATPLPQAEMQARYNIIANAEAGAVPTKDEFRQLLQKLLADRFQLKVHRDQQEMAVYSLVIAPRGPKLKPSTPETDRRLSVGGKGRNYEVTLQNVSMEDIRSMVGSAFLDRPVVDKTRLTGTYDAILTYTPSLRSVEADPDSNGISIFTAVQLDLGLKLSPEKAMVEVLIVDHVAKPSAN